MVPTDVTSRADVERLRDRAIEAFGHVDVWVNNAGRGITRPVLELTDEEFDLMMTVNVKSALYGMQAIAPHFIARGRGQIVNVSSFLSRVPFATFRSGYNAAKAALNALTANARVDLARAHPGIHVTLVMPGLVRTEFQRNALGGSPPIPAAAEAQSVEDAAAAIVDAIAHPVAEIYTNPRQAASGAELFPGRRRLRAGRRRERMTQMFELTHRGRVAVLRMTHGKANAMDLEFCRGLMAQVDACMQSTAGAAGDHRPGPDVFGRGRSAAAGGRRCRLRARVPAGDEPRVRDALRVPEAAGGRRSTATRSPAAA